MKKITFLLCTLFVFSLYSNGQNTCSTSTPITPGTISVPALNGGEVPLPECAANANGTRTAGVWYSFTASVDGTANVTSDLPANVAPNSDDTRVHIYSGDCTLLTCIGGNDDVSGANFLSDASFPVTNGTTYLIAWDDRWNAAGFDFVLSETSCLATTAPGAVTTPTPVDGATGVAIEAGDGVAFSWVEDTTGDVAESFTISIGLTATGDDIGSLADVESGDVITFGAANNTTYFWKIDAVNCFGTTSSAVWSFTTEDCVDTAPPACVTVFSPVDNEASAQLGTGGAITFTWDDVPTATSYEMFINGFSQGTRASGITFTGFEVNTSYTWSLIPSNCFGAATGCPTWNFTTSSTILNVNEFDLNSIRHYYNNTTKELTLESETSTFTNVNLYNILGQEVFTKQLSQNNEILSLSSLNDGIYIAKISIGSKSKTIKFVKN
ncbi:T9SS type A sorting domain-containing protein [uncultured Winogradskyella sp.]|uniref:T9SS type A sorting domain-containing protein n=1 Tax=uncultured Winogradskyella sp. TaxID=395353 RepID=UPI00261ECA83|nr:T9SS type A sorting domain-containing protein [uncultured Winogradskyella sp.]